MTLSTDSFKANLAKVAKPREQKKAKDKKTTTSMSLNTLSFKAMKAVANAEGVSQSQLLDLALELFLVQYAAGELFALLENRKEVSKTPRWKWALKTGVDKGTLAVLAERRDLPELHSLL